MRALPQPFKTLKKGTQTLRSWSYSAWALWSTCPLRAKYRYIERLPDPPGKAAERGNRIHKVAEDSLRARRTPRKWAKELSPWAPKLLELRERGAVAEEPWGFDRQWAVTTWEKAWLRMKLDARWLDGRHGEVIDHKTGKVYDGHKDQAELYALGAFLRHPELKTVDVSMWYIDQRKIDRMEYAREEVPALVKRWEARATRMLADTHFLPRPSTKCSWCPYAKSKKGPCKYG